MFFRIYSGIFLSIIVSVAGVYSTYQFNLQHRLSSYSQSVLQGSLVLISEGYSRQQENTKKPWFTLVGKMTGLNPSISTLNGQENSHWQLNIVSEGKLNIAMTHLNQKVSIVLDRIGEQQLRAIALLILNELASAKALDPEQQLTKIKSLFSFPIALKDNNQLGLDAQQRRRLNKGEVVVTSLSQDAGYSVYVKTNKGKILHVGAINKFEPLTTELLITLIAMSLLITSLVVYFLVYRLEHRLNVVNLILGEFGPKKIKTRVPIKGNDVITELGMKVNEMANRIEQLLLHQKELTQAVSHELRTPLARIRFRLQILSDSCDDIDEQVNAEVMKEQLDEKVIGIGRDLDQLEALIDEMLCLYKLDIDPAQYNRSQLDIGELLSGVVDMAKVPFSGINISLKMPENAVTGFANAADLQRLLLNLISNAGKHANTRVVITLEQYAQGFSICVEDDGAGIAPQDSERIFEPFTRLENARNQKIKGYGLGLAIVARIARLNQAEISVGVGELGGAKFNLLCTAVDTITESTLAKDILPKSSTNGTLTKNALTKVASPENKPQGKDLPKEFPK